MCNRLHHFHHSTLQYRLYLFIREHTRIRELKPVKAKKVAEHSFEEPMPNSPKLLNYLCVGAHFFARVKINYRSIYSRILTGVHAVAMATGLVKNKALIMVFVHL